MRSSKRTWSRALTPRAPVQVAFLRCAGPARDDRRARNAMTFQVIGASMLAGWSSAVALIAAVSGLWIVMLFALGAYYLVLRAEGVWYEAGRSRILAAAVRLTAPVAGARTRVTAIAARLRRR